MDNKRIATELVRLAKEMSAAQQFGNKVVGEDEFVLLVKDLSSALGFATKAEKLKWPADEKEMRKLIIDAQKSIESADKNVQAIQRWLKSMEK